MKTRLSIILTICVGIVGIITLVLAYSSQQMIKTTYDSNLPFIALSDNIRNKITKGHLWFEEYMAGDNSIDPEKVVIKLFDDSRTILENSLEGKESELGKFNAVEDSELRILIKRGIRSIDELEAITRKRWDSRIKADQNTDSFATKSAGAAGEELDTQFDEKYESIQREMEEISEAVKFKVNKDINGAEIRGVTTLGILLAIFITIAFLLFKFQRRTEKNDEEQKNRIADEKEKIHIMTSFADSIGQGNYDSELKVADSENDNLSISLLGMRDKLKKVAEEDRKRNWVNTGIAEIGEILRTHYKTPEEFYQNIISFIIRYLQANQGGLFLIKDENGNEIIELSACIAYDRKKHQVKQFMKEEGLIGRCVLEKATIYMTEIPDNYINITSGLGNANPNNLLIVPLKLNESIFGVIEIASFNKIENYQIDFLEKLAENLASAISNVKINEKTKLLLEQSQQQAEELRSQEEEMRQNMEELQATQEEMQRKEKDYILRIDSLNNEITQLQSK